jgi:hypothetical protein
MPWTAHLSRARSLAWFRLSGISRPRDDCRKCNRLDKLGAKMALKALVNWKLMSAEEIPLDEWRAIQAQKPPIRMFCCLTQGYMRVREEHQEFVHYRRTEECLGRPDSPSHDLLKIAVRNAARASGWSAEVEVPDAAPDRKWIADVLASKATARVAFEIQISPITKEALLRRQDVYSRSRVRCCWFVKGFLADGFISRPERRSSIFKLIEDQEAELGSPRYFVSIIPGQRIPLKEAVSSLLRGEFKWCQVRRTLRNEKIVILRVNECSNCHYPLGMFDIEAELSECGSVPKKAPAQRSLLDAIVQDAVEQYVSEHPELDFSISYPRFMACPRSRIEDIYFTCGHCKEIIGFDRHDWYWSRHSSRIAEIALPQQASLTNDPHWCNSTAGDFCR